MQYQYLIGVDGGGTGTRVILMDREGKELARGSAGPSGLMHGANQAWSAILEAINMAFASIGMVRPALEVIAVGCGLAGVNNRQWAEEFKAANPGFGRLAIETDAGTTLLGAHGGKAGAIIALGTGSVGEVMDAAGNRREVGGWGFPSSDEASGAWMGLRAVNHLQHALDGRAQMDMFAQSLLEFCGGSKDAVFAWLAGATQTKFAQLAPIVVEFAEKSGKAKNILKEAGIEVEKMANALDPSGTIPIALCGGLAEVVWLYLPESLLHRVTKPKGDSALGALILVKSQLLKS
ncbi:BadF/BadG/BcrA/BcrD ATPase family protein [Undibacterium cyanobacteriorum]|uniref:BadF/BadG/BcrA/BcrD ATPase family protein n=1 Tax=Undibacterium cyanobacteriorum TaxID=3073561 RepID=A0ABY9RE86_9BURK|nr:BadF/BadG/BcrA/BcrD ATPase family protein [Undibacterium sp. 20NA77.5]WMW79484.1 BadF/BadG/BcrA/BcrD ATPase family protein [Undibacterium sp. 20NA77.5]